MSGDGSLSMLAVGTKQGITEKSGGWFSIEVAIPGKQYPLKLDTKKQELVELARAAGDNVMEWLYTEKDSGTPNPHKPGTNFLNRYFEGVAPVGTTGSVATGSSAPQAEAKGSGEGMTKEEWARKDSAIHKMACIKTAADALKHTIPSSPAQDDLTQFLTRVTTLTQAWHRSVLAERDDPTGEDVPFD